MVRIRDQDEGDSVEAFARENVEGGYGGQEGAQEDDGIEAEGRSEAAVGSGKRDGMEQAGAGGQGDPVEERALAWVVEEGEGRSTGNTSNNVTPRASTRVQKDDRGAGGRTEVSWIDAGLTQLRSIYDKMKE